MMNFENLKKEIIFLQSWKYSKTHITKVTTTKADTQIIHTLEENGLKNWNRVVDGLDFLMTKLISLCLNDVEKSSTSSISFVCTSGPRLISALYKYQVLSKLNYAQLHTSDSISPTIPVQLELSFDPMELVRWMEYVKFIDLLSSDSISTPYPS